MKIAIRKKLGEIKEKSKFFYYSLIMIYYFITLILGLLIGFFLSDKFIYLEHTGFLHFSSFSYYNIDNFRKAYYQNSTVSDQLLKVANSWLNEIGTETEIDVIPEGDIKILCKVGETNQSCKDYEIKSGLHQILYLQIEIFRHDLML